MPHEGLTDCARGVVAGGDKDGVFGEAIHEDDQELVASIWRYGTHNINGEGIPGSMGLNGARCFLAMAVVSAQLALWAALGSLQTDVATCFIGITVTEEFPQSVAAEVGSSMQFAGDLSGLLFVLQQPNLKEGIFRGQVVGGQAVEPIHMSL